MNRNICIALNGKCLCRRPGYKELLRRHKNSVCTEPNLQRRGCIANLKIGSRCDVVKTLRQTLGGDIVKYYAERGKTKTISDN